MLREKIEKHLLSVQKPSRYIGGEVGSVVKDKSKVDVRFAFCFPDTYDIGMSHLGMKILYALKNARDNYWCERVFAPSEDFEAIMRENDIPLYALESFDPIKDIPNGVYLTGFFSNYPTQQIMDEIFAFLSEKTLVPVSGKVFDFENVKEAVTAQDEGKINGKVIVRV